jgi:hypothetical protein
MSTPGTPAARSNANSDLAAQTAATPDWTVQIADTIESVVGSIRNKTAVPLETAARAIVYGVVIAVVGTAALVIGTIALVRVVTYLPGAEVWMVYAALGTIFTVAGLFFWRKRRPKQAGKR